MEIANLRGPHIAPMWQWNDHLELPKILDQAAKIQDKGYDQVVVSPRVGIPNGFFLSKTYLDVLGGFLDWAKVNSMGVWIQDKNWPSGTAEGRVTRTRNKAQVCWVDKKGFHTGEGRFRTHHDKALYADQLSLDAVKDYITQGLNPYDELKQHFENPLLGIFDDERGSYAFEDRGKLPYSQALEALHVKLHQGHSLQEDVIAYYRETGEERRQAGRRYFETAEDAYILGIKELKSWCHQRGLDFIGHVFGEDDPYFFVMSQFNPLRVLRQFDAIGVDMIGGVDLDKHILAACLARPLAEVTNKPLMVEMFGAAGPLGVEDVNKGLDFLAKQGVTMVVPHAILYSREGNRKDDCPPDFGLDPIWSATEKFTSEFKRNVNRRSPQRRPNAAYFSVPTIQQLNHPNDPKEAQKAAMALMVKVQGLFKQRVGVDVLDDWGINQLLNQRGYDKLHLASALVIPIDTLKSIRRFCSNGGEVVFSDGKPEFAEDSSDQPEFERLLQEIISLNSDEEDLLPPERRYNIWDFIKPRWQKFDQGFWTFLSDRSPSYANKYTQFKGKVERVAGFLERRLAP